MARTPRTSPLGLALAPLSGRWAWGAPAHEPRTPSPNFLLFSYFIFKPNFFAAFRRNRTRQARSTCAAQSVFIHAQRTRQRSELTISTKVPSGRSVDSGQRCASGCERRRWSILVCVARASARGQHYDSIGRCRRRAATLRKTKETVTESRDQRVRDSALSSVV